MPNYLQSNHGHGSTCCNSDDTQFNEAVYIGQFKMPIGPDKLTASDQQFNGHAKDSLDTNPADGSQRKTFSKNRVAALKADSSPTDAGQVLRHG